MIRLAIFSWSVPESPKSKKSKRTLFRSGPLRWGPASPNSKGIEMVVIPVRDSVPWVFPAINSVFLIISYIRPSVLFLLIFFLYLSFSHALIFSHSSWWEATSTLISRTILHIFKMVHISLFYLQGRANSLSCKFLSARENYLLQIFFCKGEQISICKGEQS